MTNMCKKNWSYDVISPYYSDYPSVCYLLLWWCPATVNTPNPVPSCPLDASYFHLIVCPVHIKPALMDEDRLINVREHILKLFVATRSCQMSIGYSSALNSLSRLTGCLPFLSSSICSTDLSFQIGDFPLDFTVDTITYMWHTHWHVVCLSRDR